MILPDLKRPHPLGCTLEAGPAVLDADHITIGTVLDVAEGVVLQTLPVHPAGGLQQLWTRRHHGRQNNADNKYITAGYWAWEGNRIK